MSKQATNLYTIERNREVIFVESLLELQKRKDIITPYNLIRQSAILRFLLIDAGKFYAAINKKYDLNIGANLSLNQLNSSGITSSDDIQRAYNIFFYNHNPQSDFIKIDKFLQLPILKIHNPELQKYIALNHIKEEYNIHALIKLVANAHGGVHVEKWANIPADLMTDSTSPFNINNNSKLHVIFKNIVDITLISLRSLCDQVTINLNNTKSIGAEVSKVFYIR